MFFRVALLGIATLSSFGSSARTASHRMQKHLSKMNSSHSSEASSGIIVLMAAGRAAGRNRRGGGGFNSGFSGGNFRSAAPPPPQPPKWTQLPTGCEASLNNPHCVLMVRQSACVARHGEVDGITPVDACQKWWKQYGEMKKEPRHMYCRAAAADPGVHEMGQQLKDLAPEDSAQCSVDALKRLANFKFKSDAAQLDQKAKEMCNGYLRSEPDGTNHGFCRSVDRPGQDCEFLWGLRAAWSSDYGKTFCESLSGESGQFRCLALRKQLVRVAQAKSMFGTAMFHSFDQVIKIKRETCPEPPTDLPEAPSNMDEIEILERVDDDVETEK